MHATAGSNVAVKWVKLEVGKVATPYSPRPYVEELAMCQRYYLRYNTNGQVRAARKTESIFDFMIPTTSTMRTAPAILGTYGINTFDGVAQGGFILGVAYVMPGCLMIRGTKISHGLSDATLQFTTTSAFDAEIY